MSTVVVALGGNAILQPRQVGTFEEQYQNVEESCKSIVHLLKNNHRVVVTHGNGPQVGNLLVQNEEASAVVPCMPLHCCVAMTQGQLGYMLQQALGNALSEMGLQRPVITLVTQVEVDGEDPAFGAPTKPVGPFYTPQRAYRLMTDRGYVMKEDAGRGWRRVVPSPEPRRIVEVDLIRRLLESGAVIIASGGGGVPVVRTPEGRLKGVDAVIDKDLAAQQLAIDLGADLLMILTDVERVALNYGQVGQQWLDRVSVAEMRAYQAAGHFRAGSMGPKVEAAIRFVSSGRGRRAVIGALGSAQKILNGEAGTWIVP